MTDGPTSDPTFPYLYVNIDYTNYRGERKEYVIQPLRIFWGATDHHPEEQWILLAFKIVDGQVYQRAFAIKDIHSWQAPIDLGADFPLSDEARAQRAEIEKFLLNALCGIRSDPIGGNIHYNVTQALRIMEAGA